MFSKQNRWKWWFQPGKPICSCIGPFWTKLIPRLSLYRSPCNLHVACINAPTTHLNWPTLTSSCRRFQLGAALSSSCRGFVFIIQLPQSCRGSHSRHCRRKVATRSCCCQVAVHIAMFAKLAFTLPWLPSWHPRCHGCPVDIHVAMVAKLAFTLQWLPSWRSRRHGCQIDIYIAELAFVSTPLPSWHLLPLLSSWGLRGRHCRLGVFIAAIVNLAFLLPPLLT